LIEGLSGMDGQKGQTMYTRYEGAGVVLLTLTRLHLHPHHPFIEALRSESAHEQCTTIGIASNQQLSS